MPFAIKKGRFKLSSPAKCTSHVKLSKHCHREGKALRDGPWNQILTYKTMLWMSVVRTLAWGFHILEMSSVHTGEHTKQQRFKSKRRKIVNCKDCVTFNRTTAYHCCPPFFAGSYEEFSLRHEWFLISASLKVRLRTDDIWGRFVKTPVIQFLALAGA